MYSQSQPNGSDCGLFATELIHGNYPSRCHFDVSSLGGHLLDCLEKGNLSRFKSTKTRRITLGNVIKQSITEKIYCVCRMVNDKLRPMIECDLCQNWFHVVLKLDGKN